MSMWRDFLAIRNILVVVLVPILALPLPLVSGTSEAHCAYVILILAAYLVTEALPLTVTALLPVFLFPVVGVLPAREVSAVYINDVSMLLIGGFLIAVAVEHWNLHRRIALWVLVRVGAEPKWLLFGLILPTWFLSIWISNTASIAMMMPIANAILVQLKDTKVEKQTDKEETKNLTEDHEVVFEIDDMDLEQIQPTSPDKANDQSDNTIQANGTLPTILKKDKTNDAEYSRMCKAFSICIAYAANIGGMTSLTGTLSNVIVKGQIDIVFQEYDGESPLNFATWFVIGLPLSFILMMFLWFWLQVFFLRLKGCFGCLQTDKDGTKQKQRVKQAIKEQYDRLGKVTFAQAGVMAHLVLLALFWITRDLGAAGGWGKIFKSKYATDSLPSILFGCSLFIFPSVIKREKYGRLNFQPLMTWKIAQEKVPWGIFFLAGGGFAMAKACHSSGLSAQIGSVLTTFVHLEPWAIILVLCFLVSGVTEFITNASSNTLMMPIVASLALSLKINPLYFMLPIGIASNFSFMLPSATPPNAVMFAFGHVRVIDMITAGFPVNIVALLVLFLVTETLGSAFFDFHNLPDIFRNNTNISRTLLYSEHILNTTSL